MAARHVPADVVRQLIATGSVDEVAEQVADAVAQSGARGLQEHFLCFPLGLTSGRARPGGCAGSTSPPPGSGATVSEPGEPRPTTARATSSSSASDPPESHGTSGRPRKDGDRKQALEVRRVIDGDTIEVAAVGSGTVLRSGAQVDVRLLEIDTPETKDPDRPVQCHGEEATRALRQLLPDGSRASVRRDEQLRDQYGRHLLYVWNDDGVFVNLRMVARGHARAVLYEPNDRYWKRVSAAEERARAAGRGLWGACPGDESEPEREPPSEPDDVPRSGPGEKSGHTQEPRSEPGDESGHSQEPRNGPHGGRDPSQPEGSCSPDYSGCVPPYPPDLDCSDIDGPVQVRDDDPHRFDRDGDGVACEAE